MFTRVSQLFSELTVSAKGQRRFADVLANEHHMHAFLQDDTGMVVYFLAALQNSGPEGRAMTAAALAFPDAVARLVEAGWGGAVWDAIEALEPAQQVAVLAAPNAAWALCQSGLEEEVEGLQASLVRRARKAGGRPGSPKPLA